MSPEEGWADAVSVVLTILFFAWMFWAYARRRRRSAGIPDGPPGEPYRAYTTAFDLTLPAREVPAALTRDGSDRSNGWTMRDDAAWQRQIAAAIRIGDAMDPAGVLRDRVAAALKQSPGNWAVCLLVDQSGSMRGEPMQHAATASRWLSGVLADAGVPLAILGFSTVGWKGGRARQQWLRNGQPPRPGRLAALLHIVYQPFDAAMSAEDWTVMLHPDVLRENIDGEAVAWATALLAARPEPDRLLIVLSDGAPVDDATLLLNGPNYLVRHLRETIVAADEVPGLRIAGLGLNYRVDGYYSRSAAAIDPADLPAAAAALIEAALAEPSIPLARE